MYHPALYTPITDILGCQFPILCAGMGGVARYQLAASVSNAGGFGCIGMVREQPEFIRKEVNLYRSISNKPFAINLIPAATEARLLAMQIAECIALKINYMVFFWDVDKEIVKQCRDNGIQVIYQVGSKRDAVLALEAGVDALIVQGVEAGGHVRGETSLFGLLPEICAFSSVPIIASGGITTGEGMVAAFALGAQAISCGTLFLATEESNAHYFHKEKIVAAEASNTVLCYNFYRNWPMPAAVRVLKNDITESINHPYKSHLNNPIGEQDGAPIYPFSTDSPLDGAVGDIASMALYCGQGCGSVKHIKTAATVINDLMQEADRYLNRF
ncbi:NAD(P)H-dependent flavin oxidoreductase [Cellvibrio mixtus]|uniref:NAD(P)H-dependent flavin oxidoreductase n=1 Tax=Cellvibrio mixtus TaxID=39650 RepID=UPI000693A2EB|nr:nitronate monooxygenase [Cellvibrio mixtus]